MDKCEYYIGKQILPFDQNRTIEQEKFAYSPVRTTFEKQTKRIEEERKKQIDAITNQNKRLEALPDEYDHKSGYKEIFDKLIEERFDEIKELTDEINDNDLIYYFKNNTAPKDFNDFENGIELFRKIKSGEMKLEDAKELQNIFKTNLNEKSKG